MANLQMAFLKNLNDNLDDVLNRPEVPSLISEYKKRLPKVDTQTLEFVLANSLALLDTIENKK